MKYALMSLEDFKFILGNGAAPLYFSTYDEAQLYADSNQLTHAAVVPYEEE